MYVNRSRLFFLVLFSIVILSFVSISSLPIIEAKKADGIPSSQTLSKQVCGDMLCPIGEQLSTQEKIGYYLLSLVEVPESTIFQQSTVKGIVQQPLSAKSTSLMEKGFSNGIAIPIIKKSTSDTTDMPWKGLSCSSKETVMIVGIEEYLEKCGQNVSGKRGVNKLIDLIEKSGVVQGKIDRSQLKINKNLGLDLSNVKDIMPIKKIPMNYVDNSEDQSNNGINYVREDPVIYFDKESYQYNNNSEFKVFLIIDKLSDISFLTSSDTEIISLTSEFWTSGQAIAHKVSENDENTTYVYKSPVTRHVDSDGGDITVRYDQSSITASVLSGNTINFVNNTDFSTDRPDSSDNQYYDQNTLNNNNSLVLEEFTQSFGDVDWFRINAYDDNDLPPDDFYVDAELFSLFPNVNLDLELWKGGTFYQNINKVDSSERISSLDEHVRYEGSFGTDDGDEFWIKVIHKDGPIGYSYQLRIANDG